MKHPRNALLALCVPLGIAAAAHAFPAFTDGDFGTSGSGNLNSWASAGVVQTRAVDDPINGGALPADAPEVFDTDLAPYFTTGPFAVLGDLSGRIADAPDSGTHILARGFDLEPEGAPYDLEIHFRTAFDGHATVPEETACDSFIVRLNGPDELFQILSTTMLCNGDPQQDYLDFELEVPDLPAGHYSIWFTLHEGGPPDTLNTAAGVDNVTIEVTGATVACDDGLDNDADTLIDLLDPGCENVTDASELNEAVACDDGLDNDSDEQIDWPADTDCTSATDDSEAPPEIPALPPLAVALLAAALLGVGLSEGSRRRRR